MDYMLRTDTKEEMDAALLASGLATEVEYDGQVSIHPIQHVYIDHIGQINKPAIIDEDGVIITPGTSDTRWHTNIRVCVETTEEQIAALPTFEPLPAIPYRVFA